MKKVILLIILLALVLAQWFFKDPTIHVPASDIRFGYIVKYSGNSGRSDTLPMLVALHGDGDTAKHFYNTALDQLNVPARIILFKGPSSYGNGNGWPWTAADLNKYGKALRDAIKLLAHKYPTKGKPILMGFSSGGIMAYYQAVKYGDAYSYIFPVSGQLSEELLGDESSNIGAVVFAFHGKDDELVPISEGENAINILQTKGIEANLTEFDGGHLGIFTNMKSTIINTIKQKIAGLE